MAFQKIVTVRVKDHDRYGRTVAEIMLPDGGNLNQEILKAGMAWAFRRYCRDQTYYHLESEAREQRIGLWSQPHPTAPWDFRKPLVMQREGDEGEVEGVARVELHGGESGVKEAMAEHRTALAAAHRRGV